MEKEKPNYYAILTAEVRYDKRLSSTEKLLYAEMTALSNKTGECWAANSYFARLYDMSEWTVSQSIQNLISRGYIKSKVDKVNGNKRTIVIANVKKLKSYIEKPTDPYIEKSIHNTTSSNTKDNNKEIKKNTSFKERKENSKNYLLSKDCYTYLEETYPEIDPSAIENKCRDLFDWVESRGKAYKDYRAFARSCLRKDKDSMARRIIPKERDLNPYYKGSPPPEKMAENGFLKRKLNELLSTNNIKSL